MVGSSRKRTRGSWMSAEINSIFMRSPNESSRTITFILSCTSEQLAQAADDFFETGAVDSVDGAIELERFLRGQVPPERVLLAHHQAELPLHFVAPFPRDETEDARLARGRIQQSRKAS